MDFLEFLRVLLDLGYNVGAPILASWLLIRGLRLSKVELSVTLQKWVVYVFSGASVLIFSPVALPDVALAPPEYIAALLALAGGVMKAAQAVYDKGWKALEGA